MRTADFNRRFFFSIIFLSTLGPAGAQSFFRFHDIPVVENGRILPLAWTGGLNAPQFSQCDLDFDGTKELVVFERSNASITLLKHSGDGIYQPFYISRGSFPPLSQWMLMRDFDRDGREDIFTYGGRGDFTVYKNISAPATGVHFIPEASPLQTIVEFPNDTFKVDMYVNSVDIPAISDLDNDGDLDILTFAFAGATVELHKNLSVERTGVPGLDFKEKNACYGYFEEGFENNQIMIGVRNCENQVSNPDKSWEKHTGSTLLSMDMDGDGRQELIIGDVSFNNLIQLNMKASTWGGDSAVSQQSFPETDPVNILIFPAAYAIDVNLDGATDVVAAANSPFGINNHASVWHYRNAGTTADPELRLETTDFLQKDMIDKGEGAFALLHDIDLDGLEDLIVSSKGKTGGDGNFSSTLAYYRNTGNILRPAFTLENEDLGKLSEHSLGSGLIPSFANLDGDPSPELILGDLSGRLHLFDINSSDLTRFTSIQTALKDAAGQTIDVGDYAHPSLFDIDRDGRNDLFIGERSGNVNYYRNEGEYRFRLMSQSFGGISTATEPAEQGYSTPFLFNLNGEPMLISGARSGKIRLYKLAAPDQAAILLHEELGNIYEGERVSVSVADLNRDGSYDLIIGNYGGGVNLYVQQQPNGLISLTAQWLKTGPNPGVNFIRVESDRSWTGELYDTAGRLLQRLENSGGVSVVDVSMLAEGIYFFSVTDRNGNREVERVLINRQQGQ